MSGLASDGILYGRGISFPPRVGPDGGIVWSAGELNVRAPEAIVVEGAPGFAIGVQWHPEWNASADPVSRPLFQAFGQAVSAHASHRRAGLRAAS